MRINYNVSAMLANNSLINNDNNLSKSLARLSSGLKINDAKDNPAGLAMAKRMNAQIEGLKVANTNSSDGISIIETADGALSEVSDILQRMNELAVKASNGTMMDEDRQTIQDEIAQLKTEITRISETTEFNSQKLLNGEFGYKGYTNVNEIKVNNYTAEVSAKEYTITGLKVVRELDASGNPTGEYKPDDPATVVLGPEFPDGATVSCKDSLMTVSATGGFEMTIDLSRVSGAGMTFDAAHPLTIDVTGIGAMRLQVGANEGQVIAVDIPAISLQNMHIEDVDVSTKEGAVESLARIDNAIKYVSKSRGNLGAYQNRLESTVNSLDITEENMTAAYSRIMDVDMAEEMISYTTNQVLTQAGTSMLAQANERPSQILQLLQ